MRPTKRLALLAIVFLVACAEDSDDKPYLEFMGGGFIFNYRLAQADYGFVAKPVRRIPDGTIIEAVFENPSGGKPLVIRQTAEWGRTQYVFRTPPVEGIEANRDYRVELRLLGATDQHVIATYSKTFRSDVDQTILPKYPPVVGPGYHPVQLHDG